MVFTSRLRTFALAGGAAIGAACITAVVAPAVGSQASAATLCRAQTRPVAGGSYTAANNEWGSAAPECITTGGKAAFTVARSAIHNATNGAPGGTVTVGFTGSFTSGKTSPPAFALNGRACG